MRYLVLLLACLTGDGLARAGSPPGRAVIPPSWVHPNTKRGDCGWVSLSTVGKAQGLKALASLANRRIRQGLPGGAWPSNLRKTLDRMKLHHRQGKGQHDTRFIARQTAGGRPVLVTWRAGGPKARVNHWVIVTDYGKRGVTVIDTNHPRQLRHLSRQAFRARWGGNSLAVTSGHRARGRR